MNNKKKKKFQLSAFIYIQLGKDENFNIITSLMWLHKGSPRSISVDVSVTKQNSQINSQAFNCNHKKEYFI